jgi:D-alanyl-D-alanine carboxypeptidase/D-alanyl-D-alanine-endopeptidase (penicillin-binding protein 4)
VTPWHGRASAAAVLAFTLLIGCASRPAPRRVDPRSPAPTAAPRDTPAPAIPPGRDTPTVPASTTVADATPADLALGRAFDDRFAAAEATALWSVRLERAGSRAVLASRNADRLVLPASNMKIATLAAAAVRLGWDYRFRTTVHLRGAHRGHVLAGDLVVVGGADPTIGRGADPLATFREWARTLRAAGVQRIDGDLVGDPTRFGDAWLGDSWSWDDLTFGYAAPYSGLTFTENVVRVRVAPGAAPARPGVVTIAPMASGLELRDRIVTTAATTPAAVTVARVLSAPILDVSGTIPVGSTAVERTVAVADPPRYFLGALRAVLAEEGVEVRGHTIVERVDVASLPEPVIVHQSAPLADVAQRFMKVSQNLYGEVLLRVLARATTDGATPAEARTALHETLATLGVPTGTIQGMDGSGLSRRDFMTASAVITLLQAMAQPPHREAFRATLPIAGQDGTISTRFRTSPCRDRLFAKTGTLAHARALSGYVTSASGSEYVFSVIANNFLVPARDIDIVVEDALGLVCAS